MNNVKTLHHNKCVQIRRCLLTVCSESAELILKWLLSGCAKFSSRYILSNSHSCSHRPAWRRNSPQSCSKARMKKRFQQYKWEWC